MKIYTKTGDDGDTGLMGGERVSKASVRIAANGDIDELNAILGVCRSHCRSAQKIAVLDRMLEQLQSELFSLGADLSTPLTAKVDVPRMHADQIDQLERWIDEISDLLPPLKNFILPGGSSLAALLHLARTMCRRAERSIVTLTLSEKINVDILSYVNRLSDLLFVMARYGNQLENIEEVPWHRTS